MTPILRAPSVPGRDRFKCALDCHVAAGGTQFIAIPIRKNCFVNVFGPQTALAIWPMTPGLQNYIELAESQFLRRFPWIDIWSGYKTCCRSVLAGMNVRRNGCTPSP